MRILITGAAGYIGQRLWRGLEAHHDLRLADLQAPDDDPRWVRLDVTRPAEVRAAMADIEAVIHLARRWDLTRAETVLGYRPTIRLEELGYQLGEEREPF